MNKNLCNKVGESRNDNLIAQSDPRANTFGVKIPAGLGVLVRGTVLALVDGTYAVLGEENTGKANCVLADDVDATDAEAVGVAYRTGHFNRKALIVADGYAMTVEDEEELRKHNILLSDMAK